MLTKQQIGLLKRSLRGITTRNVASLFYNKLFTQYPEVKKLFPSDIEELKGKLMSVLELLVFSFEKKKDNVFGLQNNLIIPLRELGKRHEKKGIRPEHYLIANHLLLQSIKEETGSKFSEELSISWKIAISQLSLAMQDASIDSSNILDSFPSKKNPTGF